MTDRIEPGPSLRELEQRYDELNKQIANAVKARSFGSSSWTYRGIQELRVARDDVWDQMQRIRGKPRRRVVRLNTRKGL